MSTTEANGRPPAIFHVTHYKAGSQWIHAILRGCVPRRRLVRPVADLSQFFDEPIRQGLVYPTIYASKDEFEKVAMPPHWRRFIVIRDLRDTLVSAYFSVKISHKDFQSAPVRKLRDDLQQKSEEEGLLQMVRQWLPRSAQIQRSWLSTDDPLLRYEDLLDRDEELLVETLIERCGLPVPPRKLRKAIEEARFERLSGGRPRGSEDVGAHQRKGVAGDWRNHFTEPVKDAFKEGWGEVLIEAGYESDDDW